MRPYGRAGWSVLAGLIGGLLVVACAPSASVSPSRPEASPIPTVIATVVATAEATTSSAPPPTAEPSDPPMPLPPDALLAVEGGDPVVGALGTFTWMNGGSASPWLPGTPMHVGIAERLTLTLVDGVGIDRWTVRRSAPASLGVDAVGMADGTGEPLTFDAPPAGTWSVYVDVRFAGGLGSAAYFWLISVD